MLRSVLAALAALVLVSVTLIPDDAYAAPWRRWRVPWRWRRISRRRVSRRRHACRTHCSPLPSDSRSAHSRSSDSGSPRSPDRGLSRLWLSQGLRCCCSGCGCGRRRCVRCLRLWQLWLLLRQHTASTSARSNIRIDYRNAVVSAPVKPPPARPRRTGRPSTRVAPRYRLRSAHPARCCARKQAPAAPGAPR